MSPLFYFFGVLFWVIGDLGTTQLGFMNGFTEINPFFISYNIYEMILAKVLILGLVFLYIKYLDEINTKVSFYCKFSLYCTVFLVGIMITSYNAVVLLRGIEL